MLRDLLVQAIDECAAWSVATRIRRSMPSEAVPMKLEVTEEHLTERWKSI
jgi:hypothetical protein